MTAVSKPRIERTDPVGLVRLAQQGRLRLPSFQRLYRWTAPDVVRLFDSIVRGFPIGSLLLWDKPAPAERVSIGPLSVDAPDEISALWVVDGQQRITSIVGALLAGADEADPRFRIFYDLHRGEFVSSGQRASLQDLWLPVTEMTDNRRLLAWTRHRQDLLSDDQVALADTVGSAIRDYEIPMYVVRSDDEAVLRQVFDRMNFFGKRITQAEAFSALYPASVDGGEIGLESLADDLEGLGFGRFKDRDLYRSVLAIRGGDVFRDFRDEFADKREIADAYEVTRTALADVVRFLRDEAAVPHLKLLPYSLVIPVLARYFALNGAGTARERALLRRFVWRGAVAGTEFNSPTSSLRRAVTSVEDNGIRSADRLLRLLPEIAGWEPDLRQLTLKNAAARLNVLALLSRTPRYLVADREDEGQEVGAIVDLVSLLEGARSPLATIVPAGVPSAILAARAVHPRIPPHRLSHAWFGVGVTDEVLESQWLTPELAALASGGEWVEFMVSRGSMLRSALARYVARQAEFGARDGEPMAALLFETDGGADV